ncbi:Uncharacterized protein YisB [Cytospora mali]|uniref:Uncharacterized protein YisB n=1 Tax=Cytospora mali TaxID=578113 RepID=A0A194W057_CYTMA|nr:Uncharacterized protein YisB [Valsa mali]
MPVITRSQINLVMRPGPSPPNDEGDRVLPSVELIDLTGLSTDDEQDNSADHDDNDNGEWEDITEVIDLTNLPSDDENDAAVEVVKANQPSAAPTLQRHQLRRTDTCELCNRVARYDRGITKHHLYPQSVVKAAAEGKYTAEQKCSLALLCWPCHSAIHRIIPNDRLAQSFHSVELLKAHSEVQDWVQRMKRATTAELNPPTRSNRIISRVGAFSISQVSGVKKVKMSKSERRLAEKLQRSSIVPQINLALDTLWAQNGNSFPRLFTGSARRNRRLRDAVRELSRNKDVQCPDVREALRSRPEYREWYDWAFPAGNQAPGQATAESQGVGDAQTSGLREGDGLTKTAEGVQVQIEQNEVLGVPDLEFQNILNAMEDPVGLIANQAGNAHFPTNLSKPRSHSSKNSSSEYVFNSLVCSPPDLASTRSCRISMRELGVFGRTWTVCPVRAEVRNPEDDSPSNSM